MTEKTVTKWRSGRNFIRVGDVVRVLPSAPKKRDGFEARVMEINEGPSGIVFQLVGGNRGRVHVRSIRAERVARVAQYRTSEIEGKTRRERKR